jgi:hypothetical protein
MKSGHVFRLRSYLLVNITIVPDFMFPCENPSCARNVSFPDRTALRRHVMKVPSCRIWLETKLQMLLGTENTHLQSQQPGRPTSSANGSGGQAPRMALSFDNNIILDPRTWMRAIFLNSIDHQRLQHPLPLSRETTHRVSIHEYGQRTSSFGPQAPSYLGMG